MKIETKVIRLYERNIEWVFLIHPNISVGQFKSKDILIHIGWLLWHIQFRIKR